MCSQGLILERCRKLKLEYVVHVVFQENISDERKKSQETGKEEHPTKLTNIEVINSISLVLEFTVWEFILAGREYLKKFVFFYVKKGENGWKWQRRGCVSHWFTTQF